MYRTVGEVILHKNDATVKPLWDAAIAQNTAYAQIDIVIATVCLLLLVVLVACIFVFLRGYEVGKEQTITVMVICSVMLGIAVCTVGGQGIYRIQSKETAAAHQFLNTMPEN